MSVLKKEKDIIQTEDVEKMKQDETIDMQCVSMETEEDGSVTVAFAFTRNANQAAAIINKVKPKPKSKFTLADLLEMTKDTSVTLSQESANLFRISCFVLFFIDRRG